MPNMNGLELAQGLTQIDPEVRIILSSGYEQEAMGSGVAEEARPANIRDFLPKPYVSKNLAGAIRRVLDAT